MRIRHLWRNGHWVALDPDAPPPPRLAPYIVSDQREYRSIVTGEMIDGRAAHRDHLRAHGCVEVGNDYGSQHRDTLPPVHQDIERALQASPETHAEARVALTRARSAIE